MERFNTRNPIQSEALEDFSDNVKNEDLRINSKEAFYVDRFGKKRITAAGQQKEFKLAQDYRANMFQPLYDSYHELGNNIYQLINSEEDTWLDSKGNEHITFTGQEALFNESQQSRDSEFIRIKGEWEDTFGGNQFENQVSFDQLMSGFNSSYLEDKLARDNTHANDKLSRDNTYISDKFIRDNTYDIDKEARDLDFQNDKNYALDTMVSIEEEFTTLYEGIESKTETTFDKIDEAINSTNASWNDSENVSRPTLKELERLYTVEIDGAYVHKEEAERQAGLSANSASDSLRDAGLSAESAANSLRDANLALQYKESAASVATDAVNAIVGDFADILDAINGE